MFLFLKKLFAFIGIVLLVILFFTFLLPNPFIKKALLGSIYDKHAYISSIHRPKITLIGGSNVSFGFNSKTISDHFNMPVINMAISAGLGLKFILNDVEKYINAGDIIILSPEYDHFTGQSFSSRALINGNETLLFMLFDIYPTGIFSIDMEQLNSLIYFYPQYAVQKTGMIINEIVGKHENKPIGVYDRLSFDKFGDEFQSRGLAPEPFAAIGSLNNSNLNEEAFYLIRSFQQLVQSKGAIFYFSPPSYQRISFDSSSKFIQLIQERLQNDKIQVTSSFEKYAFPDTLFFNSAYHMNKQGVSIRTAYLINEIDSLQKINMGK